ncbi:molybdopterin oxidoreductase family protein [Candidatus Magnetobacterium casense]|uniref:Molybdopterin-dependent oxidoreductase n=1 Tax=Candidatus Magnetobacterium casense TaxID=1455061 RepID=A0ABS6S3D6_9BACT|nr:molybdopterin-dependent oxidoreductase [Candidatus Magnetobacterium casensis]MBV6343105.1 molybdopterin-dependent oxidoreductase [Candidatus Magnetobacterium casensis]
MRWPDRPQWGHVRHGVKIIVGDPRRIDLVKYADVWLNLKPGSNIALLHGLIHIILRDGLQNEEFISNRTEGFNELKEAIKKYTPQYTAQETGVSIDKLEKAAHLYAKAGKAMILYGLGVTEHRTGTENAMAVANLALTCGHLGRPSTGIMALRGQNNVQGASDMGPSPAVYTGYQYVSKPEVREKFERSWNVQLPTVAGLKSVEMFDKAVEGTFKGMFIMGADTAQTDANINHIWKAFDALEFLVVCDLFHTHTTRFADVIIPGASFAEKDGTFTNGERRVQRIRKAIEPLAGMAEWQVIQELSRRMGYAMNYSHPSQIMDEIAGLTPNYGGISYERIEKQGIQWPCPTKDHPGTTTLYAQQFSRPSGKALFVCVEHIGSGEVPDSEYPYVLVTGRRLPHYNNGSMTRRVKGIMEIAPVETIEINPADAARLNIAHGEKIRVSSRRGEIHVTVEVTERSQAGNVFLAFHFEDALTNILTSGFRDSIAGTPEYKSCAVRIGKL